MSAFAAGIKPLADRIRLMIGRAVIAAIDDGTGLQSLQLDLLADETHEGVERFGEYGLASHPHPGAEALVAFVGGLRSHGIVISVGDRRYRLKGLKAGEVALYDDLEQVVHLTRDGILVKTPKDVTIAAGGAVAITADTASITADRVDLGGTAGSRPVARLGDTVSGGVITEGSDKVFAA